MPRLGSCGRKSVKDLMDNFKTTIFMRPYRRFVVVVTFVLVTAGIGTAVVAATQRSDTSERDIRSALDQYSLDPRIAALGAVSQADVAVSSRSHAELLNAANDLEQEEELFTAFAFENDPSEETSGSREALEGDGSAFSRSELLDFIEIQNALDVAVEELYGRASTDDRAVRFQESWRQCMQDRGHNFGSPMDIETAITGGSLNIEGVSTAIRDRDECSAKLETDFEYLLLTEFIPDWSDTNSDLLDRYERILDIASVN